MGAKLEEKVLRSIANYRQRAGRFLLDFADRAGGRADRRIWRGAGVEKITPAGSLRRGKETVGDLDLLVTGAGAEAALDRFVAYPRVTEVLGKGANKASAQVRARGPAGGRARAARARASAPRCSTSPAARSTTSRCATARVKHGLQAQRVRPVPRGGQRARRRRDRGGDLRSARPGLDSAGAAREPGRDRGRRRGPAARIWWSSPTSAATCTCTRPKPTAARRSRRWPQRPRERWATSTSPSRTIRRRWPWPTAWTRRARWPSPQRVREVNRDGLGIRVFSRHRVRHPPGRPDGPGRRRAGRTRLRHRQRPQLHEPGAGRDDGPAAARARDARTCASSATPPGRVLLHRDAYPFDFERVAARGRPPRRLARDQCQPGAAGSGRGADPRAPSARARNSSISTDAHHPKHLANMRYGVTMARRGWLEAADVVNTLPLEQFTSSAIRRDTSENSHDDQDSIIAA